MELRRYDVFWFNDYRRSKIFRTQIFKFYENIPKYAEKFNSSIANFDDSFFVRFKNPNKNISKYFIKVKSNLYPHYCV